MLVIFCLLLSGSLWKSLRIPCHYLCMYGLQMTSLVSIHFSLYKSDFLEIHYCLGGDDIRLTHFSFEMVISPIQHMIHLVHIV